MDKNRNSSSKVFEVVGNKYLGQDFASNFRDLLTGIIKKDLGEDENVNNSGLKGAGEFKKNMRAIYDGPNLGENKPMLTEGIKGKETPKQWAKIFVYKLPNELSSFLSGISQSVGKLADDFISRGERLRYASYSDDSLHISINQSGFVDKDFTEEEKQGFSTIFNGINFNNIDVVFDGVGLSGDSIVVKFRPKNFLPHICNQIKSTLLSGEQLSRQGWGLNCTIGRFVGESNNVELLGEIGKIAEEIEEKLKGKTFKLSEFKTGVLYFSLSLEGDCVFKLN